MKSDPEKVRGVVYEGPQRGCCHLGCVAIATRAVLGSNGRTRHMCDIHAMRKGGRVIGKRGGR